MKIFLYKSLFIFFLVLILFKLTIGKLITNYEKKFDELLSKEYVNKSVNISSIYNGKLRDVNFDGKTSTAAGITADSVQKLSFEELRSRLPNSITNDIVTLIANSEQALVDFANIQTQQDVNAFNLKYEVSLQMPAEA